MAYARFILVIANPKGTTRQGYNYAYPLLDLDSHYSFINDVDTRKRWCIVWIPHVRGSAHLCSYSYTPTEKLTCNKRLFRFAVRPMLILTAISTPLFLFLASAYAFSGSFFSESGVKPTWGETVGYVSDLVDSAMRICLPELQS